MSIQSHPIPQRAEECHPLPVGRPIPDISLETIDGRSCSLDTVVRDRPAFIVFYRGGW